MSQFDIVELSDKSFAIVLQANLLDTTSTKVVAPLVNDDGTAPESRLHPRFRVGRRAYILLSERLGAVPNSDIKRIVRSVRDRDYDIRRALDIVFVGV